MITLVPITSGNASTYRSIRLRALQDSPSAFGSTYARESHFTETDWTQRITRWSGETGIGYLAMDGSKACGIAGVLLETTDSTRADLVSMWTAPTHRKQGIGRLLVEKVPHWAAQRGVETLYLMVTSNNPHASLFYERLGFTRTGHIEPYPNDPALLEYEMSLPLT